MTDKMLKLRRICMVICALLVFVYLVILCIANPSKELLFALAVEIISFGGVLFFRLKRSRSVSGRAEEAVISELAKQYSVVKFFRRFFITAGTTLWLLAAVSLTVDCSAFSLAFFGAGRFSSNIYKNVPISLALGLHPAASLEVLAGAYVEAQKFDRAMPLYDQLLRLRLDIFGREHKEIAAIYCDFGDLYSHQKKLTEAENYYRKALAVSTALLGDKGSGRAYTRLADCLRDQGRYDEAIVQYQNAYNMRVHQFGPNSEKVAETLAEWAKLLRLEKRDQEAGTIEKRVASIQSRHREPSSVLTTLLSLFFFAFSLSLSFILFGRKGLLTELAVDKMKTSIDGATTESLSKNQLKRLITLYKFQKKVAEVEHYSAILNKLPKV